MDNNKPSSNEQLNNFLRDLSRLDHVEIIDGSMAEFVLSDLDEQLVDMERDFRKKAGQEPSND